MGPTPRAGGGEDPGRQGAALAKGVPDVDVSEAAPAEPEATKRPTGQMDKLLEWIKAVGMPLATIVITAVGGYYFTNLTKDREARESNERLYAQLLTQREQSDALIRKDMFGVVIKSFLEEAKQGDWTNKILQLELLANNFNQSLDLAPLFKDLARRLPKSKAVTPAEKAELKKRLDLTAAAVIFKQVNSLARRGYVKERSVALAGWKDRFGKPFIDVAVERARLMPSDADASGGKTGLIRLAVEIVDVSIDRREVEVRLRGEFPGENEEGVDRHFWVGQYDFPMLDNTQLRHGLRTSVVITDFFVPEAEEDREANSFVKFHLVVFPAASASFKERQDYDDILLDILRAKGEVARRESEQR